MLFWGAYFKNLESLTVIARKYQEDHSGQPAQKLLLSLVIIQLLAGLVSWLLGKKLSTEQYVPS